VDSAKAGGTSAFDQLVYRMVRRVPRGNVVTYGQVAALIGHPRSARAVGSALGALGPLVDEVPWQRVIDSSGRCSHRDSFWAGIQRELLEAEGVGFDGHGRVELERIRWAGPRPARAKKRRRGPGGGPQRRRS
jgi:methylated-DNA-protein-cysteine methyltransferase related protein